MNLSFSNKEITGILTILPKNEISFEESMGNYNFSETKSIKLKKVMGFGKRRVALQGVCSSDLCIAGLQYLFDQDLLDKDKIDALLLITQSPDYLMPPTSNLIQGYFCMKEDMICMDINQGCAGYVVGLVQAFMLLDQPNINQVVLLNADVLTPKVSKFDRNSDPIIGDAASVTIVQKSSNTEDIFAAIKMNGQGAMALNIPAGGARIPFSEETCLLQIDNSGNSRSRNHLIMKGDEVFSFVLNRIPELINQLLETAKYSKESIDYFMFHQPNKFILNKLADEIGVEYEKMPSNVVENFGNASGVTIPLAITYNLGQDLTHLKYTVCIAGFGVGLTWGALILELGNLKFCTILEV